MTTAIRHPFLHLSIVRARLVSVVMRLQGTRRIVHSMLAVVTVERVLMLVRPSVMPIRLAERIRKKP